MTDADPPTIGARLALDPGRSRVIAILDPELAALNHTVAASGAMLDELIRLGRRLNAFNVNAAPIAARSDAAYSYGLYMESVRSGVPKPVQSDSSYRPTAHGPANARPPSPSPKPPSWPMITRSDRSPPPRAVSREGTVTDPPHEPQSIQAVPARASLLAAAPMPASSVPLPQGESGSAVAGQPASDVLEGRRPPNPQVDVSPLVAVPTKPADGPGRQPVMQVQRIVIGDVAPVGASETIPTTLNALPSQTPAPTTQDTSLSDVTVLETHKLISSDEFVAAGQDAGLSSSTVAAASNTLLSDIWAGQGAELSDRAIKETVMSRFGTPDGALRHEATQPASGFLEQPHTDAETRQGTIVLDETQLGRWMIGQLERHASLPSAIATGIDPRMSATYPGAPTGI